MATDNSFHGRTISMVSATGQARHRARFKPQMPGYSFIPYADLDALAAALDAGTAAFIVEPVQGEGGVNVPPQDYLRRAAELCHANGSLLIVDEVQTGFCRTGPMFATSPTGAQADFLTMAKGIAGGFPLGAFACTEEVAARFELGDHGGTYCGNPLGCAVAHAVIGHLVEIDAPARVDRAGGRGPRRALGLGGAVPGRGDRRPRRRPAAARRRSATSRPPAPSPPAAWSAGCSCARRRPPASASSRRSRSHVTSCSTG